MFFYFFFFFQAEDGIRDLYVTGVQTCALPICASGQGSAEHRGRTHLVRQVHIGPRDRQGGAREGEPRLPFAYPGSNRSEERRVGKECRARWVPEHEKKRKEEIRSEQSRREGSK